MSAAYEAAKLPEKEQQEIAKKASGGSEIKAKEIAVRTVRKGEKGRVCSEASKLDTGQQPQTKDSMVSKLDAEQRSQQQSQDDTSAKIAEDKCRQPEKTGKIKPFKKTDRHTEILREWRTEDIDLPVVAKSVTDAIERVSNLDTAKTGWSDMEWRIFIARAIMNRADCVSEDDLYLLHDIMIRCQEG